jgi:hypothetical protein
MREIDEILVEDAMLRHSVETTKTAGRYQTAALLMVLFGVLTILGHSFTFSARTVMAAKGPQLERGHHTPLDERWFW